VGFLLRLNALVFAIFGLFLLANPELALQWIGLVSQEPRSDSLSPELLWLARAWGISLLIASLLMPLLASYLSERGLRQAGSAMMVISFALSFLIVIAPGEWVLGRILSIALGTLFGFGYLFALQGRRRNL
jgi:hypothetical protein